MRANPTDAERKLWAILRAGRLNGYKFKRQVIIDSYIADFVNFEHRVIVEADGSQHADSEYDVRRDAYLHRQGFRVLRFWNGDVLTNPHGVAETIWHALQSPPLPSGAARLPPSPARGEGKQHMSSPLAGEDSEACGHGPLAQLGEGVEPLPKPGASHV